MLNQVRFDLEKLVCLYNATLIALIEIKKQSIMNEDFFNNEKIYLEEMIIFLFYLLMKSKNLAAFISFIIIIDGLFFRKLIMTIKICFFFALYHGHYLLVERKKPARVKK